MQHLLHTAAASVTYGCSLCYIRLQPLSHTVAAYVTYGFSLYYIRLQVEEDAKEAEQRTVVLVTGMGKRAEVRPLRREMAEVGTALTTPYNP